MRCEVATNCCRICLTKSKKLRSLYKTVDEVSINEMLQKITGIEVEEIEEHTMLPKNICKNCELSLSMAFEFREKALQSHDVIVSYMRDLKIPFDIKEETECQKNTPSTNNEVVDLTEDQQLESSPLEKTLSHRDVETLNTTSNRHSYSSTGTEEMSVGELIMPDTGEHESEEEIHVIEEFTEEGIEDVIYEDSIDEICSVTEMRQQSVDFLNEETEAEHIIEQDQNDEEHSDEKHNEHAKKGRNSSKTCASTQDVAKIEIDLDLSHQVAVKDIPRGSIKAQRSPKHLGYICDICGNVYAKRSRMMEHRQRHDKELKYACELCDKKFHMRELLRKHMYSHSGGKPLKCEYCSRTFYYESVRKAHEAVHQGVKPYICDVCGRAFGYSHSLKKHKLIHAEVKLYRCNYCNKDFRLQHHMKQHVLTKSHQKAAYLATGNHVDKSDSCSAVDNDHELVENVILDEHEITNDS